MDRFNLSDVRAVIVTYCRYGELLKTFKALENEGMSSSQFIIIDNNPEEGRDAGILREYATCTWILPPQNIASAGGFQLGMMEAHRQGAAWAWLFNDDSRPKMGAFFSLTTALKSIGNVRVGLIKTGNLNNNGLATLLNWKGVRKPEYIKPADCPVRSDLVTFDGCMVSARLMGEIGYCDPEYFMGTYEFDYCLKAKDAGFHIFTVPNGLIEDGKLGSVGGTPPWRQYYNTRNHLWLGINRRDLRTVMAWLIRELKFTYAILKWEDQKLLRLRYKVLATWDALRGKRGKVFFRQF